MRVLFMGTGEIALPTFKRLADSMTLVGLVTQPDRPVGRRSKPQPPRIKEEALARSIPVLQPEDVRRESEISAIAVLDPEPCGEGAEGLRRAAHSRSEHVGETRSGCC